MKSDPFFLWALGTQQQKQALSEESASYTDKTGDEGCRVLVLNLDTWGTDTDFPSDTQRLRASTAGIFKTPSLPMHPSLRPSPCWCPHSCLSLWPWKEDWTKWHMNQMEAAATSVQASDLNDWKTPSWFLSASLEVGRAAVTKVGTSF